MQHSSWPTGSDDNSDTSTNVPDIFSYDATDDSLDNTSEPDSINNSDDNSDDDSILGNKEECELPMQYYLQEAKCLDVSCLWQRCYSLRTQDKLDETWKYWDWWETVASQPLTGANG